MKHRGDGASLLRLCVIDGAMLSYGKNLTMPTSQAARRWYLAGKANKDGGEDVRDFRRAVLDGHVRAPESLLLRSALSEARVITDAAGNSKLAKKTEGGRRNLARDDAAAAAILAISEGYRRQKSGSLRAPRRMRIGVAG